MPRAELSRDGQRIEIACGYHERHLAQLVPGARYQDDVWSVAASWSACTILRGVFGTPLELGPALVQWAKALRTERLDPALALRDVLAIPDDQRADVEVALEALAKIEADATLRLYDYQVADLAFLLTNGRALLANEPGLGKTGVVIRTLQVMRELGMDPFPVVITCPNSLKRTVWEQEFAAWAPEVSVSIVDGGAATRRKQLAAGKDVYVINYEALRLHSRLAPYGQTELTEAEKTPKELNALDVHTAIFDEAHKVKDPHAKQTRAAWAVAHQAEYRIAMTGTPVADTIADLWPLLHLIEPTWFPAKTKWLDRYAVQTPGYWGGVTITGVQPHTKDELFRTINPLMRRVPKTAALPQLPPKLPVQYRETPMTPKQEKAYKQMEAEMLVWLEQQDDDGLSTKFAPTALAQLTRLLQFAAASAELLAPREVVRKLKHSDGTPILNPTTGEQAVEIITVQDVQLTAPSSKVDDLVDLLEEMGEAPLVVAAVSRQLIELAAARLEKEGISHGLVTGAQSTEERQHAVQRFQAGEIRVILLTLGAGAEGITLTRADTMLFMQDSFSMIQNAQAEDRVHRIGSEIHESIRIIKQITPGTVEERKLELLAAKADRIEEVVQDKDALRRLLGADKADRKRK
jgi:SNF2 family DNA or RNA helicase